jgi:hypothetical protein
MLREITMGQLIELIAFDEIYPTGETRMDFRFALGTSAHVGAVGGKAIGGKPYTAGTFLEALNFDSKEEELKPVQSVTQMEIVLRGWMDASNQSLRERGMM